jgi:hypothetical protein
VELDASTAVVVGVSVEWFDPMTVAVTVSGVPLVV